MTTGHADPTTECFDGTLLVFVARIDVHLESEVDENRHRGQTHTAGSDHGDRRTRLEFGPSHTVDRHGDGFDEGGRTGALIVVHREHRIGVDHHAIGESSVDGSALETGEGIGTHIGLESTADVALSASPDRANGHPASIGKTTAEFVSESDRGRSESEHVDVAAADPGRLDGEEETVAGGFGSLDHGDRAGVATYGAHRGIIARTLWMSATTLRAKPPGQRVISCDIHHISRSIFISCPRGHGPQIPKGVLMYVVALFIVMAILLEAVMKVLHSILGTVGLEGTVNKIPVVGANLTLGVSILMVWLMGNTGLLLSGWGWQHPDMWINYVANGAIIAGMIPLKDAVFNAIHKGLRA